MLWYVILVLAILLTVLDHTVQYLIIFVADTPAHAAVSICARWYGKANINHPAKPVSINSER